MSYSNPESALSKTDIHTKIRILIVDNQSLHSELLRCQIKPEPNMRVVATANDEAQTFAAIQTYNPNLVIIDTDAPGLNGTALLKKINYNYPLIKTVVFTQRNELQHINRALNLGAKGFLIKNSETEETKDVLNAIAYESSSDTKLQLPMATDGELTISQQNTPIPDTLAIVPSPAQLPAVITEAEDWSGATKDLLDGLPQIWTRGLLYCLLLGTCIILPWSILTKVDQTGTARGRLEPRDKVVELDAPVAGKVQAINVKEGEKVKKGAILVELGSEIVNSELEQLQEKLSGQQMKLTELKSMENQAEDTLDTTVQENQSRQSEKGSQQAQAEQSLNTLKALYQSQKGEKLAQIDQVKEEINASSAALKEAELTLSGSQEKARRYKAVFKEGVISQDLFLEAQQKAKENQERRAQASSAVAQAKSKLREQQNSYQNLIKQSESEIAQASLRIEEQQSGGQTIGATGRLSVLQTKERIKDLESQVTALETEIVQTEKQIKSIQFQLSQRQLLAPADGVVFHIPARGKGSVVQPGEKMVEIAPENSNLILTAQMPPTDSGFLKKGMPVKVKFDAYPFQDYGISDGKLISSSPDSKEIETPQGTQEVYELRVELEKPYIVDGKKRIALTAGQTATADVIIRQRRVIDFFIDPFRKLQKDGVKL